MEDDETNPEIQPSRYLLPPGCKDLIDVLRPASSGSAESMDWFSFLSGADQSSEVGPFHWHETASADHLAHLLPPACDTPAVIHLPPWITVNELAIALGQKPFLLVALPMAFGRIVSVNEHLAFEDAANLCARFGTIAKKAT